MCNLGLCVYSILKDPQSTPPWSLQCRGSAVSDQNCPSMLFSPHALDPNFITVRMVSIYMSYTSYKTGLLVDYWCFTLMYQINSAESEMLLPCLWFKHTHVPCGKPTATQILCLQNFAFYMIKTYYMLRISVFRCRNITVLILRQREVHSIAI